MSTILNNPAANAVLAKFVASGNETCFHGRHINPQIYEGLDGSNWSIKDYEARGGYQALKKLLGKDGKKRLYDHLRTEDGRVPASAVESSIMELFQSINAGKNSASSPN